MLISSNLPTSVMLPFQATLAPSVGVDARAGRTAQPAVTATQFAEAVLAGRVLRFSEKFPAVQARDLSSPIL
ncbi:hypothetical protein H103_01872 [Trichophyton rubrum CBS 288.86]|uniref:Uncharacterized protein n=2 Tax=Trichophyton TaxID=5550 RepID=A0A022WBF4_TRIRU|nr:hypothetical protein H103_01872 [Trichophyton rubrum CBS 288.86]EZF76831.1 hypothetical protein H105_01877 [Trichophyton soudanense CBS 452.61]